MFKFEQQQNRVKLSGRLNFETVADLLNKSPIRFDEPEIQVDLSEITRFNSASLALLLDWLKKSQQKGCQIKYHNAPDQLLAIAHAYGIEQELPLTSA